MIIKAVDVIKMRAVRESAGLTQRELGLRIGVTHENISHYESGNKVPTLTNAVRIADVLGVKVDDLVSCIRA